MGGSVVESKTRSDAGPQGNSTLKKFYWVIGAVAVMGVGLLVYSIGRSPSGQVVSVPVDFEGMNELGAVRQMTRGVSLGPDVAPISIIEFSDFECPSCAFFALEVKPRLERELIEPG